MLDAVFANMSFINLLRLFAAPEFLIWGPPVAVVLVRLAMDIMLAFLQSPFKRPTLDWFDFGMDFSWTAFGLALLKISVLANNALPSNSHIDQGTAIAQTAIKIMGFFVLWTVVMIVIFRLLSSHGISESEINDRTTTYKVDNAGGEATCVAARDESEAKRLRSWSAGFRWGVCNLLGVASLALYHLVLG